MHYYSHNIGDYRRDTAHLSMLEHGAYRQLMDSYYLAEKPLTLVHADLMRTQCARTADEVKAIENVLRDFFVRTDEGYIHKRCDVEIEAFHSKSTSASESAKARWARVRAEKDADAMRTHSEGNANHKPITINHKPITKNQEPSEIKNICDQQAESPKKPKANRATKIPEPFLLTGDMRVWGVEKTPNVNLREETENFVDYWRGAGKTKVDWIATWRTWMRKAQKDSARSKGYSSPVNRQQQVEEANARVVQQIIARETGFSLGEPIAIDGEVIHVE